jgi:hypothetical protein
LVWRERRPALGYESLFPTSRDDFVRETALAIAADVAEFWLAALLAGLVPIALWRPDLLTSPALAAGVLGSALMQVLVFGATFLAARSRSWAAYVAVLCSLIAATAVPLAMATSRSPTLTPVDFLLVALVEMTIGLALAAAAYVAWRRVDVA